MKPQILYCTLLLGGLCAAGCGNQMMRQPSYQPLDTPRASSPAQSVPFSSISVQWDARPIESQSFGSAANALSRDGKPIGEPSLPPPNLSDDASNQPAPAILGSLHNPLPPGGETLVQGHTLFLNRCVQCHDPGGTGVGPVGGYLIPPPSDLASSTVQQRSDGALFWTITQGQGKMPGFKSWTTPAERWALVSYTRSLRLGNRSGESTIRAPYPVYGVQGFENGAKGSPHYVPGDQ